MLVLDRRAPGDAAAAAGGMSRRAVMRGLGLGAGAVLLGGCGGPGGPAGSAPGRIQARDQRGRAIELDGPARRIVTIVIPAASLLVALDSGPGRLVGVNSSGAQAIRQGILGEMFPAAVAIPGDVADQSFAPNVETILGLDPDLVIQWGDRGSEIIAPLESAGLTVAGLSYGTQADLETWIELFGTLIGRRERARLLVDRMHQRLDALRARVTATAVTTATRPRILYLYQARGGLKVGGGGTYNDFYIDLVGGVNPAAGLPDQPAVDPEQVLAWDPDVILVGNFDAATPADVYDVAAWRGLSAVRRRRVYKIPLGGYRWDPPCQESPLMWSWLHALAHPDADPSAGRALRAAMVEEYQLLYGHALTDGQIDRILMTEQNAVSAHYEMFRA